MLRGDCFMTRRFLSVCLAAALAACDAPATPPADASPEVAAAPKVQATRPAGCAHTVYAPVGTTQLTVGDRDTVGPDPTPRNVHVSWAADPATTIAAVWKTDAATRAAVMQLGAAPDRLDRVVLGQTTTARSIFGSVTQHEAHACGLAPDTTYYYRVGAEGHWSEVQRFKTAPGRPDVDVTFAVTGDSRDSMAVWRATQERILSTAGARQPDFELFTGDAIPFGVTQEGWDAWFDAAAPTQRLMPFMLAHGNHEGLSLAYLLQVALPQVGSASQDELYYSFEYGPVHFAVLNDTPYGADYEGNLRGDQVAWLRRDLAAHRPRRAAVPWVVVAHHKPAFSASNHSEDGDVATIRSTLPPVFDELGVDLVLNGHEHNFEVSRELDGSGRPAVGRRGVVYVVSGGAGAGLYGLAEESPWRRYGERVNHFLLVRATQRSLEVTPHRIDGTVIAAGRVSLTPRPR